MAHPAPRHLQKQGLQLLDVWWLGQVGVEADVPLNQIADLEIAVRDVTRGQSEWVVPQEAGRSSDPHDAGLASSSARNSASR